MDIDATTDSEWLLSLEVITTDLNRTGNKGYTVLKDILIN